MATRTKSVLIIGASGGIGAALVAECRAKGYVVTTLSRQQDGLDITNEDSVKAAAKSISGGLDLIVIATGALEHDGIRPERSIQSLTSETMIGLFKTNAVGPALLLKYFTPKLTKARKSVVMVLSARVGSIDGNHLGGWASFRASKAALNQIIRTVSIELGRKNKNAICLAYHPGTVQTKLSQKFLTNRPSVSPQAAVHDLFAVLDGLKPHHTGQFLDWAGKPINW